MPSGAHTKNLHSDCSDGSGHHKMSSSLLDPVAGRPGGNPNSAPYQL